MEEVRYSVYVLQNPEGQLYIGFTTDLDRRVRQHQDNKAGWTRNRGPWKLVHYENFTTRADALRRERNLKRGRTNQELRKRLTENTSRARPSNTGRINR